VQHRKRKHTKKHKKKISTHRSSEPFGYQPDNPITKYYARYIGKWEKREVK
jgi:hypothetical protein